MKFLYILNRLIFFSFIIIFFLYFFFFKSFFGAERHVVTYLPIAIVVWYLSTNCIHRLHDSAVASLNFSGEPSKAVIWLSDAIFWQSRRRNWVDIFAIIVLSRFWETGNWAVASDYQMLADATNWDEAAYRESIYKEREIQTRTVFRTAWAPSLNGCPETIVAASSDGSIASYSIASCISKLVIFLIFDIDSHFVVWFAYEISTWRAWNG